MKKDRGFDVNATIIAHGCPKTIVVVMGLKAGIAWANEQGKGRLVSSRYVTAGVLAAPPVGQIIPGLAVESPQFDPNSSQLSVGLHIEGVEDAESALFLFTDIVERMGHWFKGGGAARSAVEVHEGEGRDVRMGVVTASAAKATLDVQEVLPDLFRDFGAGIRDAREGERWKDDREQDDDDDKG